MPRRPFMPIAAAFQAAIAGFAFAAGWFAGIPFWQDIHFTPTAFALGIAATIPLAAAVIAIAESKSPWFEQSRKDFDRIVVLFKDCSLLDVAVLSLLAGVGEEALFRGVLQNVLADFTHPWLALALASAVFGAFHLISPAYALGAAIIGAYLGALYLWTGNLLVPILVHALYDFALLIYAIRIVLPRTLPTPPQN